jgi:hypothetical protein
VILIQACTGTIGFAHFLRRMKVPSFDLARCRCNTGTETVKHILVHCPDKTARRRSLIRPGERSVDFRRLIGDLERVRAFGRWLIKLGRLEQFSLAKVLLYEEPPAGY